MTDISISDDIYILIQEHARALSTEHISLQPAHLSMLESLVKVAKDDWRKKNEQ